MNRYVAIPTKARWVPDLGEETIMPDSMTVHEETPPYERTGLLDSKGTPLYRAKDAIGFKVTG